jgi:hypothetical protein
VDGACHEAAGGLDAHNGDPSTRNGRTVLIRFSHWRWILFALLGVAGAGGCYAVFGRDDPDGLTGGSTLGLWYGVAGAACMLFAGALPLLRRKSVLRWRWTGPRQTWLRGHIWLGLLSGVLILLHSGGRFRGTLVAVLSLVFALTLVSGVVGLIFQGVLPRLATRRAEGEVPLGQLAKVCQVWLQECDAAVDQACGPHDNPGPATPLRRFHEQHVRPFLREAYPWGAVLLKPTPAGQEFARLRQGENLSDKEKDVLAQLELTCADRRAVAAQQWRHGWLHAWLLLHVPLSAALLVLALAHVWTALLY